MSNNVVSLKQARKQRNQQKINNHNQRVNQLGLVNRFFIKLSAFFSKLTRRHKR